MNNLAPILEFMKGKKTFTLCIATAAYIIACDWTDRKLNDKVIGLLATAGAFTMRSAIPSESKSQ